MKKIVCEVCEGTDFLKQDGTYICQTCGMKYSASEIKSLLREVEGDAPAVPSPAPVPVMPAVNPNQQQIENLLVLASTAFESANNEETERCCNKAIELDVTCYKAWLLKGQAIGWESTYDSPRVEEGANAMRKAVDFAPEEEKEEVAKQALHAIKNICNALASLAKKNFSNNPTEENRLKFGEFLNTCAEATDMFNDVSPEIRQVSFDEWKEHKKNSTKQMNYAGVAAIDFVRGKWKEIQYPNNESLDIYLDWFGEIASIFSDSITWGKAVDDSAEDLIIRYKNRIIALEEPMDACSYEHNGYTWVKDKSLTANAKRSRKNSVDECRDAITALEAEVKEKEKAAEEARLQRIKAYWEAHAEEKAKIDTEIEQLSAEAAGLTAKVEDLTSKINEKKASIDTVTADYDEKIRAYLDEIKNAQDRKDEKTPAENEILELTNQIELLGRRRENLGIFAGKEKKQIDEQVASLNGRITNLKSRAIKEKEDLKKEIEELVSHAIKAQSQAKEEKERILAEIKQEIDSLHEDQATMTQRLEEVKKRISKLQEELTKDPEE